MDDSIIKNTFSKIINRVVNLPELIIKLRISLAIETLNSLGAKPDIIPPKPI
jgi:hypothetical protein